MVVVVVTVVKIGIVGGHSSSCCIWIGLSIGIVGLLWGGVSLLIGCSRHRVHVSSMAWLRLCIWIVLGIGWSNIGRSVGGTGIVKTSGKSRAAIWIVRHCPRTYRYSPAMDVVGELMYFRN